MLVEFSSYFPFWKDLTRQEKNMLETASFQRFVKKGQRLHNGSEDCIGLLLVLSGKLRVFMHSKDGREITLYHLLDRDICLFSASCMMVNIQFEVMVEAACDTEVLQISAAVYQKIMKESASVANYTNALMAARFSDVMWLLDQILYKKLDSRLAAYLLEAFSEAEEKTLQITHEEIARHLGSAREVISRMLKYFMSENIVSVSRGKITLLDIDKLRELAEDSIRD